MSGLSCSAARTIFLRVIFSLAKKRQIVPWPTASLARKAARCLKVPLNLRNKRFVPAAAPGESVLCFP